MKTERHRRKNPKNRGNAKTQRHKKSERDIKMTTRDGDYSNNKGGTTKR